VPLAILRALEEGRGRVGRSLAGIAGETVAASFFDMAVVLWGGEDDEDRSVARVWSTCICSFPKSPSVADESWSSCLRRWSGRSCTGVDFGRGGGVTEMAWPFSDVSRCKGAVDAPECRRRRVAIRSLVMIRIRIQELKKKTKLVVSIKVIA
jgi:hypothetical protein